jgi:predicted nucleic acid-binding protein
VGDALILETTFLIDLEREAARQAPGPAHALLARHSQHRLYLWIAAAGLAYRMPVVTRNTQHFQRVPGLEVVGYS